MVSSRLIKLSLWRRLIRADVLDPTLVRPGRFDRKVTLDLPDRNDREEILKIHSMKKPLEADVNLRVIAQNELPGFSGGGFIFSDE